LPTLIVREPITKEADNVPARDNLLTPRFLLPMLLFNLPELILVKELIALVLRRRITSWELQMLKTA